MSDYEQRISITVDGLTAEDLTEKTLTVELSLEDIYDEADAGPVSSVESAKLPGGHIQANLSRQAGKTPLADLAQAINAATARHPFGRGGW